MFLNRHSLVLILLSCTTAYTQDSVIAQESPFNRIAQAHLASFPVIENTSSPTKPKTFTQQIKPWTTLTLTDRDLFSILYQNLTHSKLITTPVFNTNGIKDLELICGYGTETQANILNTLQPVTAIGTIYTAYLLDNPTADVKVLQNRQNLIRILAQDTILMKSTLNHLTSIKDREVCMVSVLKDTDVNQRLTQAFLYTNNWPIFKYLKALNKSIIYQNIASLKNYAIITAASGYSLSTVTEMAKSYAHNQTLFSPRMRSLNHDKVSFEINTNFLALYLTYLQKTMSLDAEVHAQKIMIGFARLLQCVDFIAQTSNIHAEFNHMDTAHLIKKYTKNSSSQLSSSMNKLVNLLRKNTFKENESYFSLQGNTRAAYALLLDCKDELHELFTIVGELDTYVACAILVQKSENQDVGYCFAEYIENASTPSINATNIWHPLVGPNKSVVNSIELGSDTRTNIILTGPNAGGKSTFLKGLTLNVLFAQSFGIVPAKRFVFTPFAKINTYMNIADDTAGGNSLFKSEVLRAQSLLNTVKTLPAGQFSFSVMDEMFSGTSPKEGEAASYAVAEKIGSLPNSMLLLATHFQKLTGLQDNTDNFKNYQVRVERHDNGTFSYPFKLAEGKADQNVAIEILQQQGFDTSILDSANTILEQN